MKTILPAPDNSLPHPDQVQSLVSFLEHEPQPMIVLDPSTTSWPPTLPISGSLAALTNPLSVISVIKSHTITMSLVIRRVRIVR